MRRIAAEHVMNCYVIWKFAENIDGAKQFLVDLVDHFASVFEKSEFYNFPCYPDDGPEPRRGPGEGPEGRSAREVHRARGRPRLGDQRGLPGLRDGRDRRGLQHLRHPDHVRPRRARRDRARGRPWRRRSRMWSGYSRSGRELRAWRWKKRAASAAARKDGLGGFQRPPGTLCAAGEWDPSPTRKTRGRNPAPVREELPMPRTALRSRIGVFMALQEITSLCRCSQ